MGAGGELEQARARVRQLEREAAVLEQQLAEKTQSARGHVEELTCMRSELARERAVLARVRGEGVSGEGGGGRRRLRIHGRYAVAMSLNPFSLSPLQERQESREAAGLELRKERAAHAEQCRQLEVQAERLQKEKREGDREIGTLRASLKGEHHCTMFCGTWQGPPMSSSLLQPASRRCPTSLRVLLGCPAS